MAKKCPRCGVGFISIEPFIEAKEIGTFSVAGMNLKTVARTRYRAVCSNTVYCSLRVVGRLEGATTNEDGTFTGGYFVEER